jgi:hypothetical protein
MALSRRVFGARMLSSVGRTGLSYLKIRNERRVWSYRSAHPAPLVTVPVNPVREAEPLPQSRDARQQKSSKEGGVDRPTCMPLPTGSNTKHDLFSDSGVIFL